MCAKNAIFDHAPGVANVNQSRFGWGHYYSSFSPQCEGAQWLSGRVLDLETERLPVRASLASLHCGP